jgi:PHB accumulation regulatory protein
MHLRMVQTA